MRTVLAKTSLALALGVAAGAAWAQADSTNIPEPVIQQQAPTDTGASGSAATTGEADTGATVTTEELPASGGDAATGSASATGGAETESGDADATSTTQEPAGTAGAEQPASEENEQATETEQQTDDGTAAAQGQDQQPSNETTSAVNVTVEQRTEIRNVIREVNVEPVRDIDFDVSIGVAVPRTIEFYPLPPRIIEYVPAYRDYVFFVLADGRIVIVEPASYEIVLIIA